MFDFAILVDHCCIFRAEIESLYHCKLLIDLHMPLNFTLGLEISVLRRFLMSLRPIKFIQVVGVIIKFAF